MSEVPSIHGGGLTEDDLGPDPIARFHAWLDEARAAGILFPEAAALATADAAGAPSARHVLMKQVDEDGFTFYTNLESRKGGHLAENPRAALAFLWRELDRQVCVTGVAAPHARAASRQSRVVSTRDELDAAYREIESRYRDDVPVPPHWGGFRLDPDAIEFWKGREHRLHDRFRFTREPGGWRLERLWP